MTLRTIFSQKKLLIFLNKKKWVCKDLLLAIENESKKKFFYIL